MSQDTAATPVPAEVPVEEEGHKVFVGNLSFQTTEEELSALFSSPTPVLKANIITRGTRSLGYGFVAYKTLAQAEKAVAAHNKTELGGREINVEVAKPKVERPAPTPKAPRAEKEKEVTESGEAKPKAARPARVRANRARNGRGPRRENEGEEGTAEEAATATEGGAQEGGARKNNRNRNARRAGRKAEGGAADASAPAATPAPHIAGPPSKTTVFVANLPFAMEDDGLKELFAAFKVTSAHVVRRRGSGRSKGFGFVELADEAEQLKVLEQMKNAAADGRELVIKIALSEEHKEDEETAAAPAATA